MASFVNSMPVTGFSSVNPNFSNSLSRRRPRYIETTRRKQHNKSVNKHAFNPVKCSTATPDMGKSHDDSRKQRRQRRRTGKSKGDENKRNLEMGWRYQMRRNEKPVRCEKCNGTGQVECGWCHATGVLMLGDRLMCSLEGQSQCLACENGEVKCKRCNGTGKIAPWMLVNDV